MEQIANDQLGISVPSGKKKTGSGSDVSNFTDDAIPVGVPIRRVVARALAKARAHEIGLGPTLADVSLMSSPRGRKR